MVSQKGIGMATPIENSGENSGAGRGRPENLTPWQKGCPSSNPGGRPRKKTLTEALEQILSSTNEDGETHAQAIARQVVKVASKSMKGCTPAFKKIADRVEGAIRRQSAESEKPAVMIVVDIPRAER
jgi:Family of unknown function (DUF5681)